MTTPYPIKDYRNAEDYPEWEGINKWRWEFLRRNPEYQMFHAAHHAEHTDDPRVPYCGEFGIRSLYDPMQDNAFMGMTNPAYIVELPTFEYLAKWEKVPGYTPERGVHMLLRTLTELQAAGDTLVAINRALPLQPQLDAIREAVELRNSLDGDEPALKRDRRGEWPFYLRVMDGLAAGASYDDIAAALYPDTENNYPDFPGRKKVQAASKRALLLSRTFAAKQFALEK